MPRTKKITVVNIDDNEPKNDEVIDVTEPIEEPIEVPQEPIEKLETIEEDTKEVETPQVEAKPVEDTPVKQPETNTKTRLQELVKCPKCNKMVTSKTLKYSHKNTCSGEEKNQLKKEKPLPKPEVSRVAATDTAVGGVVPAHDIEEVPQPKLVRSTSIIPEREVGHGVTTDTAVGSVVPTASEIMREYRQKMMKERIQLRQDKMKNLFANSIK